eukprot:TRINITY_DN2178_c0_g1_i2.p1 TRINITY_DN2178_c0_g1~~TRINITY_DN2178_c0_g1_i2.p1  ORF type:complete len:246 (+),score=57.29 TRINITY_DN2178_c0_g1_i2:61-798(+)
MEGEHIYNWVKKEAAPVAKAPRHISKHNPKTPVSYSTLNISKKNAGTFGTAKNTRKPTQFLKKGEKTMQIPMGTTEPKKFSRTVAGERKAAVPKKTDRPILGLQTTKNYVVSNAVENILAVPPSNNQNGMKYTQKADYGKVPDYLCQIKDEVENEKSIMREAMDIQRQAEQPNYLPEEERIDLINALKAKWEEVNVVIFWCKTYVLFLFRSITAINKLLSSVYHHQIPQLVPFDERKIVNVNWHN